MVHNVIAGIKEIASRPPAALGLLSFQMLRYQFWGFGLFVFALYAKNLVTGGADKADTLALAISGLGGFVGGALGLVLAQKWKDRIPPIRLLLSSMACWAPATLVFGAHGVGARVRPDAVRGFFAFFMGKISADTITQQAMPDDFRGRAFALFDIAYNVGFIVPAFILSFMWVENSEPRTRVILMVSGVVFLGLTALGGLVGTEDPRSVRAPGRPGRGRRRTRGPGELAAVSLPGEKRSGARRSGRGRAVSPRARGDLSLEVWEVAGDLADVERRQDLFLRFALQEEREAGLDEHLG